MKCGFPGLLMRANFYSKTDNAVSLLPLNSPINKYRNKRNNNMSYEFASGVNSTALSRKKALVMDMLSIRNSYDHIASQVQMNLIG